MEIINEIFGEGKELNALQMGSRALVMFFITLILIRIAGIRTFGKKSAFDDIIVIMLGAILSRIVTGASAFFPTLIAGLILVLIHKIMAIITVRNKGIGRFLKGVQRSLYKNGKFNERNLRISDLSHDDVMEEVRKDLNQNNLEGVEEIIFERGGKLSILKKPGAE